VREDRDPLPRLALKLVGDAHARPRGYRYPWHACCQALGPPEGGPSALEPCPAGAPVLPDRTPAGGWSGAPCRLMGDRRDADLRAWHGRSRPARARVTTEWPAVRVLARGGGEGPIVAPCLTQRRERGGRVHGLAHQLAQRALPRAAGDRLGEHVFGRLGTGSDGTRNVRRFARPTAPIWL
jgi:hypothetical protein